MRIIQLYIIHEFGSNLNIWFNGYLCHTYCLILLSSKRHIRMCLNNINENRMHLLVQNRRYFYGNKLLLTQSQESRNQVFLSF